MGEIIEIELMPVRKLFYKNTFGIYGATSKHQGLVLNDYDNFTIKGKMQELKLDTVYKAKIEGVDDPKYGFGYNVHAIYQEVPQTVEAQRDYLSTVMTELQLEEIYKVYPDGDIIELMKNKTFEYKKVKGFGEITYERVRQKIMETLDWQILLSNLGKYGLKYEVLKKLVEHFGSVEIAIQKVNESPYCLTEISGIGFKKADVIARNMGIEIDDPNRIRAGIIYTIEEEQNSGHTYIEKNELLTKGNEILQVDQGLIEYEVDRTDGLYIERTKVALKRTYNAERYVAERLKKMLATSEELGIDVDKFLFEQEEEFGIQLTNKQKEFFHNFNKYNVSILVGYAGCGKSMLQKLLVNLVKKSNLSVGVVEVSECEEDTEIEVNNNESEEENTNLTYRLLAPTGKAAKVLSAYVEDQTASTIHRAIGYGKDKETAATIEITDDIIIIDEVSMLDVYLASMTLKKITNPRARLVLIGDDFQIPSVSCGNVLKDILDSSILPVTKLDQVFRQSEGGILDIASKIRTGEKFIDSEFVGELNFSTDTIFRSVEQEWMENGYRHYYKRLLKDYIPDDIMVLSSTKKGNLGTVLINKNIQEIVNPPSIETKELKYFDDCVFRVGDYIINTKNTYDRKDIEGKNVEIVNGDMGKIKDIIPKVDDKKEVDDSGIYIEFDFGTIQMGFDEMNQLLHAWCLTMHKSQGSAAKSVLIVMDKSHKFQLNANLIYTAITRCREKLVILCQSETLNYAMKKFENMRRNTFLCELLTRGEIE